MRVRVKALGQNTLVGMGVRKGPAPTPMEPKLNIHVWTAQ